MTNAETPPLDATLARLYDAETGAPPMPEEALARLRTRLAPILDAPPLPAPTSRLGSATSAKLAAIGKGVAIFVAGCGIGAAVHAYRTPTETQVVVRYVERPVASASAIEPAPRARDSIASIGSVPSALGASAAAPVRTRGPLAAQTPPASDASLPRERQLLETARSAVARRDGDAALVALDRHAKQFPSGQLAEEREALAVQALVLNGETDEARRRAARFEQRFPGGLFGPVVESALGTKPR